MTPVKKNQANCSSCGKPQQALGLVAAAVGSVLGKRFCSCDQTGKVTVRNKVTPGANNLHRTANQRKKVELLQAKIDQSTIEESLAPGSIIGSNYRIIEQIGQGGMGVVMKTNHIVMNTQYALKLLMPAQVNENNWMRFQSEARTMASLSHPTFVKVYDLGLHKNLLPYYVMDLLSGYSLEAAIIEQGSLSLHDTIVIFLQVLDGLAYAHKNGIIHRDLKPSNIMLDQESAIGAENKIQVKILDFGIAKSSNKASFAQQSLTGMGEVLGSPCYMSPEQCLGETVDARSDIYSIGCCLFETLTGLVPFDAQVSFDVCLMHQSLEPPSLSEIAPTKKFPEPIEYVVRRCLAKSADDRYQSAEELANDLQQIRAGRLITKRNTMVEDAAIRAPKNYESQRASRINVKMLVSATIGIVVIVLVGLIATQASRFFLRHDLKHDEESSKSIEKITNQSSLNQNSLNHGTTDQNNANQIETNLEAKPTLVHSNYFVVQQTGKFFKDQTVYVDKSKLAVVNKVWNTTLLFDSIAKQVYFLNEKKRVYVNTAFNNWPGSPGPMQTMRTYGFAKSCLWKPVLQEKVAGMQTTKCILKTKTKTKTKTRSELDTSGRAAWYSDVIEIDPEIGALLSHEFGLPYHSGLILRLNGGAMRQNVGGSTDNNEIINTLRTYRTTTTVPAAVFTPNLKGYRKTTSLFDVVDIENGMLEIMSGFQPDP